MNICLLTRRPTLESGGIGRVTLEIKKNLTKNGNNVSIISADKTDLASYFKYTFIDLRLNMPKGYDIYHAITPMESIWIPKNKSVATVLDIIPIVHPELHGASMGGNRIKYTIGRTCFTIGCKQAAKCKHIVCISEHVRQEFIDHFNVDENKVKVIKLGIHNSLSPEEKKDKTFRVGYLGQLDRRKRVDKLITSFKRSKIIGELVLAGKGMDERSLKELAREDPRIRFLGFMPDSRLADFYNSLDIFIFPTSIEGYGLPPVEAMACKKPVIVLEDAIIPWEVKSKCHVVEDLGKLFSNPSYLEDLCKNTDYEGNHVWAKSHNWETATEEYIKLYEEIIN